MDDIATEFELLEELGRLGHEAAKALATFKDQPASKVREAVQVIELFLGLGIATTAVGAAGVGFVNEIWQLYLAYTLLAIAYGMGAPVVLTVPGESRPR